MLNYINYLNNALIKGKIRPGVDLRHEEKVFDKTIFNSKLIKKGQ